MLMYNTQNYWVFGLYPSFSILKTREHYVSETGLVPFSKTFCSLVFRIPDDG
jgi:hypothetical protein